MAQLNTKALVPEVKTTVPSYLEQVNDRMAWTPSIDILESDREIILLADMPGVKKEDLKINLHKGVLTLEGESAPWGGGDDKDILIEHEPGRFYRQIKIASVIDEDGVEAQLKDGVLRLTLPRDKDVIPHRIRVATG